MTDTQQSTKRLGLALYRMGFLLMCFTVALAMVPEEKQVYCIVEFLVACAGGFAIAVAEGK